MADPASGTAAAATAVGTTTGTMFALGQLMPPGASLNEFIWGSVFSMAGAFAFQFIAAQVARQRAADANVPQGERPTIDRVMLGYAMCGAPMSAALLIFGIHQFQGGTGFGDTTWFQSAAGFMVAGATGPNIVIKAVAFFVTFINARIGTKGP